MVLQIPLVARSPVARVAAVLAAAALATPLIGTFEGTVKTGYRDPVGIPTSCTGHTGPDAVVGRKYTDDQCAAQLATDAVRHGLDIDACLPPNLPIQTRAAFISMAFNVGAARFCSSTLSRRAMAGDLKGACTEVSKWTYAGTRQLPGLVRRRAAERRMCEQGLS